MRRHSLRPDTPISTPRTRNLRAPTPKSAFRILEFCFTISIISISLADIRVEQKSKTLILDAIDCRRASAHAHVIDA